MKFVIDRTENIVGRGENAGLQNFLLSHNVFEVLHSNGHQKLRLCGKWLNNQNSCFGLINISKQNSTRPCFIYFNRGYWPLKQ